MKFILGKKVGMTQIFKDNQVIPVSVVEAGPVFVTQIKTEERDGYRAIQVGYGLRGDIPKTKEKSQKLFKILREYRLGEEDQEIKFKENDCLDVSQFQEGDRVKIRGISKGKGFQGGVKRWGFKGGPASHGHRHNLRGLGSVGSRFPQRVLKGKKMPGRMGGERVTIKNLEVVKVVKNDNLLLIKGAIPGRRGGVVEIRD